MQGRRSDESKLSVRPQAIRARLRNNKKKRDVDLALLNKHQNRKPVEEWDLEELARGKPRLPDGTWARGGPPKWISPAVQDEVAKRFRAKAFGELTAYVGVAIKVLTDLLQSDETDSEGRPIVSLKDKIDIAKFIVEHVIGKAPATIQLNETPKYKEFLAQAIVLDDGDADYDAGVIEGVWEEVDDDE